MESWQFIQSPAGEWYWLCSNVISRQTRTSTATFKTRTECVANAMGSGYQKIVGTAGSQSTAPNVAAPARPARRGPQQPGEAAPAAKRAGRRSRSKPGKRSKSN